MKIYIEYNITNAPHGGGNQFLRGLREEFLRLGYYSETAENADIILFNSHHNCDAISHMKKIYPGKIFVHRLDGPMRLYNNMHDNRDDIVYSLNEQIADATIFQNHWSRNKNLELGLKDNKRYVIIGNAVDSRIFNYKSLTEENKKNKIRIISSSFSKNYRKGHKFYEFLDTHLDFKKYEYVFAGNSPINYENINLLGCLDSHTLASELKKSDLYITASENDPCSNSLLEAIACGLKILALNSGGHPELVKNRNNLFNNEEELLTKITQYGIINNVFNSPPIQRIATLYLNFFGDLLNGKEIMYRAVDSLS